MASTAQPYSKFTTSFCFKSAQVDRHLRGSCLNQAQDTPAGQLSHRTDCVLWQTDSTKYNFTDQTALQNCNFLKTDVFLRETERKTVTQKVQVILLITCCVCLTLQINNENELSTSFTFLAGMFFFILCYRKTQWFLLIRDSCFFFRS